jgi:hypothetical protein
MHRFLPFFRFLFFGCVGFTDQGKKRALQHSGLTWMVLSSLLNLSFWILAGIAAMQASTAHAEVYRSLPKITELAPIKSELLAGANLVNSGAL